MADINASIGLDSREAVEAINKLARQVDELLGRLGKRVDLKVGADTSGAKKAVNDARTSIEAAAKKTAADIPVKADTSQAVNQIRSARGQFAAAGKDAGEATSAGFKGQIAGLGDSLKGAFGGALLGGGLAGAVTAGVSALTSAAKAAFDEYKSLNTNIRNIGTLGIAEESLGKFETLITDLSTKVPDKASDIANGVYQAISAGISGTETEIVGFVETASKVAVAGLSNTEEAVNGLTTITNAYGLGAKGAKFAADSMFAAIKAGKTSFAELNQAMAQVVPTAAASKVGFDTVAGSLAFLTANGIPTRQASTALNAALVALQKPNKELAKALKAGGLELKDLQGAMRDVKDGGIGLQGVLGVLQTGLKKTGQSVTTAFSSKQAAKAVNTLLNDLDKTNAAIDGVRNSVAEGGVAEGAYEAASKGLQVQLDILRNNIQAVFNNAFKAIIPVIDQVVNIFTNVLKPVIDRTMTAVGEAFSRLWPIVKPVLALIGGAIIAQIVTSITLTQTVLTTLLNIAVKVFDRIKQALDPLISRFTGLAGAAGEPIDPVKIFTDILEIATTVISEAGAVVADVAGIFIEVFVTAVEAVVAIVDPLLDLFKGQATETKNVAEQTKKAIPIIDQIKMLFLGMRANINGVVTAMREAKVVISELASAFASGNILKIFSLIGDTGNRLGDAFERGKNELFAIAKAEEEAAAAAAAKKKEEEEEEETSTDTAELKKTALERATAAYKKQQAVIKSLADQEKARLQVLRDQDAISESVFNIRTAEIDKRSLLDQFDVLKKLYKAQLDADGFLTGVGIKLNADESIVDVRNEVTKLVTDLSKLTAVVSVKVNLGKTSEIDKALNELFKSGSDTIKDDFNAEFLAFAQAAAESATAALNDQADKQKVIIDGIGQLAKGIGKAFQDAYNDAGRAARDFDKEAGDKLTQQLKQGEISYRDYAAKVGELNEKMADDPNRLDRIMAGVNGALTDTMATLTRTMNARLDALASKTERTAKDMSDAFTASGAVVGASFVAMVAQGENAIKSLVLAALDGLQAIMPILIAEIFGKSIAANPITGTILAAGLTAALTALVEGARAAVSGAFEKGGLVSGGRQVIQVNERGEEFVVNADATRRFMPLLEAINSGRITRASLDKSLGLAAMGITFTDRADKGAQAAAAIVRERDDLREQVEELTAVVRELRDDNRAMRRFIEGQPVQTTMIVENAIDGNDIESTINRRVVKRVRRW